MKSKSRYAEGELVKISDCMGRPVYAVITERSENGIYRLFTEQGLDLPEPEQYIYPVDSNMPENVKTEVIRRIIARLTRAGNNRLNIY